MTTAFLKARVITLTRDEARKMRAAETLPTGHATLNELTTFPRRTVYHIEGTRPGDYRIHRVFAR
jgi:hypothetical protein